MDINTLYLSIIFYISCSIEVPNLYFSNQVKDTVMVSSRLISTREQKKIGVEELVECS